MFIKFINEFDFFFREYIERDYMLTGKSERLSLSAAVSIEPCELFQRNVQDIWPYFYRINFVSLVEQIATIPEI